MKDQPTCFLIDDDLDDQEIFSLALTQVHPSVLCVYANDGLHGIERLNREPDLIPRAIFIDMNMPRMNGIECLKEIKKIARLQQVPVYMYSTAADTAIIDECKRLGATDFIRKSAGMTELENTLSAILQNNK